VRISTLIFGYRLILCFAPSGVVCSAKLYVANYSEMF